MLSDENMDSVNLQKIFPQEIWLIVTANLLKRSPSDFESLANSSPFFRNLLAPKRTLFLFEKVMHIVSSTMWKTRGLRRLPIRNLLNLRRVCSHWNNAVDKLISENLHLFKIDDRLYNDRQFEGHSFRSNDFQSIQKFIDHFQVSHPSCQLEPRGRSPFILRKLTLNIYGIQYYGQPEDYPRRYLESLETLLLKYGAHIQNLTINVDQNIKFFNNSSRLCRWLGYMPNLIKLSIYCENESSVGLTEVGETDQTFKLKCLETRNIPSSIFNLLIRQSSQVSTLTMKNCKNDYDFFTFPLPNLKKLEMKYCSAQLRITLGFPEVQWPLESITLTFDNGDNIGCAGLLKVIEDKFANTLVNLDLRLFAADTEVEGPVWQAFKTCRLALPKLKKIKLDVCANLTCLDFMLPMKDNLEEISINGGREFPLAYQTRATNGVTVQFTGFENKMMESNIWEIFTKLRKLEIKHRWDRVNGYQHWSYSRKDISFDLSDEFFY